MPQPAADRFRATVRKLMDERGVTIADLARSIGSARPGISRVLAGKEGVTIERAERIAAYFQADLCDLLTEKQNRKNSPRTA